MIVFTTDEPVHPFVLRRLNALIPIIINFPGTDIEPKFTAMHHDISRPLPEALEVCYVLRGELLEVSTRFLSISLIDEEDAASEAAAERSVWKNFIESIRRGCSDDNNVDIPHGELTMLKRIPSEDRRGIKELGKSINELVALLVTGEKDGEFVSLDKSRLLFCICWYYVTMDELLGRSFSVDNADICYVAQCSIGNADGCRLAAPGRTGHQDGE